MVLSRSERPLDSIDKDMTTIIPIDDGNDFSDDVPFQRFDSPCPLSLAQNVSTLSDNLSSSFVVLPDSSTKPFSSIDTNAHTSDRIRNPLKMKNRSYSARGTPDISSYDNEVTSIDGDDEDEENEYQPRPHSANSIASVWKSVASKTQILSDRFSLCGAQQEHAEEENHIPFHPSEVRVDTIQLRTVQSTSALKLDTTNGFNFDTSQMRRSCSTPTKFQPGKSGSAFGRLPINASLSRVVSNPEDNEVAGFGIQRRSAFNRVESKVDHTRSTSKHNVIPDGGSKLLNDTESVLSIDDVSESSKRSLSARALHKVKMKRRERRQQNEKDKSPKTKPISATMDVTVKEEHANCSSDEGATRLCLLGSGCHGKSSKNNIGRKNVMNGRDQSDKKYVQDSGQHKVSYLPVQPIKKPVEEEDILGVDFADIAFSEQHISKNLSRESPTTIPPPAYHQISDDEQPAIQIPPSRPRQFRRHTPSARPCTPQPPKVLSLRATLQGNNMSPCSQDSCAQSRMTSRSGHSKNTFSTSLSGSCNRSVTSSVAEADKEVRDTNRRELRRRHVNDFDGAVSIHSSDTTSTNPNAYLALTSNPPPPREGASMPVDRFFSGNASIGVASHGSNASCSTINNGLEVNPFSGQNGPPSIYSRSPVKMSNRPMHRIESIFSNEEPPRIVSCTSKQVLPPLSRESMAYSKLGFDRKNVHSSSSSKSSSVSSSSRSKGKSKQRNKYKKMASPPPPPPPCNSILTSHISPYHGTAITPPAKFGSSNDALNRGAFRPKSKSSIGEHVMHSSCYMSVVTPEKF